MRFLLSLREINWLAVLSLIVLIVAAIVTYSTNPPLLGPVLAVSALTLAKLSEPE
jgi:hypothetical protein